MNQEGFLMVGAFILGVIGNILDPNPPKPSKLKEPEPLF
jgi:hypothetical protein